MFIRHQPMSKMPSVSKMSS